MNFNVHSNLEGKHAFLSASKYHWINYTEDKLMDAYSKYYATLRGTELHELAKNLIKLKVKLPKSKKTLNAYVNDAIGFRMTPEQTLYYSDNCFGTADAISFNNNFLRIHDLKTGSSPTSIHQLEIYAALFCLEYRKNPKDLSIELRIYQNDEILVSEDSAENIEHIMDKIIMFDQRLEKFKSEVL